MCLICLEYVRLPKEQMHVADPTSRRAIVRRMARACELTKPPPGAGRLLLQSEDTFSVASMPYYQQWVNSNCGSGDALSETSECGGWRKSAASNGVVFPQTPVTGHENIEFKDATGGPVLSCTSLPTPSCSRVLADGTFAPG